MAQQKVTRKKGNQARLRLNSDAAKKRTSKKHTKKGVTDLDALGLSADSPNESVQRFVRAVADYNQRRTQDLTQRGIGNLNDLSYAEGRSLAAYYRNGMLGLMELFESIDDGVLDDQTLLAIDDALGAEFQSLRDNETFLVRREVQESQDSSGIKKRRDTSSQEDLDSSAGDAATVTDQSEDATQAQESTVDLEELTRLSAKEQQLYAEKKKTLDKMVDEITGGNLIAITDRHKISEPFDYATLLMKLARRKGVTGTFMIEGPQAMDTWGADDFETNHRAWNQDAFGNNFQADAAQEAINQGWEVKTVDTLSMSGTTKVTPQGWPYGGPDRQNYIGDKVQEVVDSDSVGKVIVIGTDHVKGNGPFSQRQGAGGLHQMLSTQFKASPKISKDTKRSRLYVINLETDGE